MTDGASSSAKRKPSLAPRHPPREMRWWLHSHQAVAQTIRSERKNQKRATSCCPGKNSGKKDYGEKKSQIPFNAHFFCRQLPGYSIPLLCHNNPHCFFVFVCCLSRKIPGAEKPYQPCGYGENASMFLLCVFCIAEKLRCVEKALRRIELQKIHKPSDNDISK